MERALRTVDLTLPQYRVLAILSKGTLTAGSLAGGLAVSRPAITTLVDGLVARGYVERLEVAGDRRRVDHVLTDEGLKVLWRADEAVEQAMAALCARLPEEKRAPAIAGLELWGEALDDLRAEWQARR